MIILTQRLKKVAELIGKTEVLADIGCDHGHLPIHLLLKKDISFAYACDVRDGPLEAAKKNLQPQLENAQAIIDACGKVK